MNTLLDISLTNALTATALALGIVCLARFYRRPALIHALWLLVLLKLIAPPFFRVPVSLLTVPSWTAHKPTLTVPRTESDKKETEAACLPAETARGGGVETIDPAFGREGSVSNTLAEVIETPTSPGRIDWLALPWPALLSTCWLTGSLAVFATAAWRIRSFHRLLHYGRPAPELLQDQARQIAQRLGLSWCPRVLIVPGSVSPLVWSFLGPARLVLPAELLRRLRPDQHATLLAHELAHVQRHDHWVRWLELVATGVYWWHPVAWWARRKIQELEEECCDAWVIWAMPTAARAYAKALLETVNFLADAQPVVPSVASGLGYVHFLKRRLNMILSTPLCHRLSWPSQVAALVFGLAILLVSLPRLIAEPPDDIAALKAQDDTSAQEESDQPASAASKDDSRDLDRRLRTLEKKMDKVIKALEKGQSTRPETLRLPAAPTAARQPKNPSDEAGAERLDALRQQEKALREQERQLRDQEMHIRQDVQRAIAAARVQTQRAASAAREVAKASAAAKGKGGQSTDQDSLKDMERQIQDAVNKAVNPEAMKEMNRHIQELIKSKIDPDKMDNLGREIERAVNKAIDPKRLEAMGKQIEAAVNQSLKLKDLEKMKGDSQDRARREKIKAEKVTTTSSRAGAKASGSGNTNLERRMQRLEERMDRLLNSLENKPARKSSGDE